MNARRLDDPPLSGAENMARDEALLLVRRSPTLRFYHWVRPTVSLGYFQPASSLPLETLRRQGRDVVRRPTGGKAILHDDELTYSLCLPEEGPANAAPARIVARVHGAVAAALERLSCAGCVLRHAQELASDRAGSPWCFEDSVPTDLVLRRRKVLGSAARRLRGWILVHGSLVVHAPAETPAAGAVGFEPDRDVLSASLAEAFELALRPGAWDAEELETATRLAACRYSSDRFTLRR